PSGDTIPEPFGSSGSPLHSASALDRSFPDSTWHPLPFEAKLLPLETLIAPGSTSPPRSSASMLLGQFRTSLVQRGGCAPQALSRWPRLSPVRQAEARLQSRAGVAG